MAYQVVKAKDFKDAARQSKYIVGAEAFVSSIQIHSSGKNEYVILPTFKLLSEVITEAQVSENEEKK
jgi:hypothetical protein